MQPQTLISLPPRPPFPPRRVATGAPQPNPRRQGTDVLYTIGMEPSTEFAGPRVVPVVPEAPPTKPPASIETGVASLASPWNNPWARRLAWGLGLGMGARFVVSPIAAQFLTSEQESNIADVPLLGWLTGYTSMTPEEKRRQTLAAYL